ncbi:MAG: alpha/beta hydrolase [Planctomycetota bacterium]
MFFQHKALHALLFAMVLTLTGTVSAQDVFKDVPFDDEAHTLDIYRSNPTGPTVLYIPGGSWYKHDKNLYAPLGVALARYGINLIVPQYGQEQKYPGNLIDIVEAVRWSQANLAQYGLSSTQFHMVGHSAGAHLAYMSLTDHRSSLNENDFKSLTLISGLYDINFLVKYGNKWQNWGLLQGWHASPIHTKRLINLPLNVVYAENDYGVVKRQTNHFLQANAKICQPLASYVIPRDDHLSILINFETNGLQKIVVDTITASSSAVFSNVPVAAEPAQNSDPQLPALTVQETPTPATANAPPASPPAGPLTLVPAAIEQLSPATTPPPSPAPPSPGSSL